jgi:hypothetical protein
MSDFYGFAGEHPVLTFLLAGMMVRAFIRLVPWSKREKDDP